MNREIIVDQNHLRSAIMDEGRQFMKENPNWFADVDWSNTFSSYRFLLIVNRVMKRLKSKGLMRSGSSKGKIMNSIKLTDDQIKELTSLIDHIRDAQVAFKEASKWIRKSDEILWETLRELFPNYEVSNLDWDEHKIIIQDKKP